MQVFEWLIGALMGCLQWAEHRPEELRVDSWEDNRRGDGTLEWGPRQALWVSRLGMGLPWEHHGTLDREEDLPGWVDLAAVEAAVVVVVGAALTIGCVMGKMNETTDRSREEEQVAIDLDLAIVCTEMVRGVVGVEMEMKAKVIMRRTESVTKTKIGSACATVTANEVVTVAAR